MDLREDSMCKVAFCFLGQKDLEPNKSPIYHLVEHDAHFHEVVIINLHSENLDQVDEFFLNLQESVSHGAGLKVKRHDVVGDIFSSFEVCYQALMKAIDDVDREYAPTSVERFICLNPELPLAMAAGLLLGKTVREACLLQWNGEQRSKFTELNIPFEVSLNEAQVALTQTIQNTLEPGFDFKDIVQSSACMREVLERAERVAQYHVPVLITGESGTGKTRLAQAIHARCFKQASQKRPFVAINCGAIPKDLLESELFGATKGAFTGAVQDRKGLLREAHGGTLFLDEVAELSLDAQSKLLRVLETQRVRAVGDTKERLLDFRLICATHQNLYSLVEEGVSGGVKARESGGNGARAPENR